MNRRQIFSALSALSLSVSARSETSNTYFVQLKVLDVSKLSGALGQVTPITNDPINQLDRMAAANKAYFEQTTPSERVALAFGISQQIAFLEAKLYFSVKYKDGSEELFLVSSPTHSSLAGALIAGTIVRRSAEGTRSTVAGSVSASTQTGTRKGRVTVDGKWVRDVLYINGVRTFDGLPYFTITSITIEDFGNEYLINPAHQN